MNLINPEVALEYIKHYTNGALDRPLPSKLKRGAWAGRRVTYTGLEYRDGYRVIRVSTIPINWKRPAYKRAYGDSYITSEEQFQLFLEHHPEMKSKQLLWEMSNGTAS